MNQAIAIIAVGAGGALGSIFRLLINNMFVQRFGPSFPWGTLTINVSGAFCIGIVLAFAQTRLGLHPYARLFLATGILGGYTTFSTFAFEIYSLSSPGFRWESLTYAVASVVAGVIACTLGVLLVRSLA
jgi:CrcB protein